MIKLKLFPLLCVGMKITPALTSNHLKLGYEAEHNKENRRTISKGTTDVFFADASRNNPSEGDRRKKMNSLIN